MDCPIYETLLKAYVSSTADYLEAVNVSALASAESESFSDALDESREYRSACEVALSALKHHKAKHGCQKLAAVAAWE